MSSAAKIYRAIDAARQVSDLQHVAACKTGAADPALINSGFEIAYGAIYDLGVMAGSGSCADELISVIESLRGLDNGRVKVRRRS